MDFCTNSCDYREDRSCDDGGPESDYQGCPLGTDCSDCGPRKIDLDQEKPKFHTFSGSDGLYKLQQKYGGSVAAMLRWNGLWDVASINVGQKLAVNAAFENRTEVQQGIDAFAVTISEDPPRMPCQQVSAG